MKLCIRIAQCEDGSYVASCPSLPGCVARGRTKQQAQESMSEALEGYLASVCDFVPERIADEVVVEV
jgi:predicted RNase H-like HicB family nuclease